MSTWIVREEIRQLDIGAYEKAANELMHSLRAEIDCYYRTACPIYGDEDVPVKSFLWIKTLDCEACSKPFDLFPGYVLARKRRHPRHVLVCPSCGNLNEIELFEFLATYVPEKSFEGIGKEMTSTRAEAD